MINLGYIGEIALLLAAAYLLGCLIGYGIRRMLYAGRGTRSVPAANKSC